ncbi:riboflavin synthase [Dyadobacter sp. BE34]|uniref:Riboflavin synthase n=1 Tax=Dyadobacter fermentans TaxID=94254 RepID=A0ABU1R3U0_9BACT|nr:MULTISPECIES: riboflavin synthase [Dyadobacter]MDR6808083.1 riboflavin synthase [Dyadobacter fermentans]MDR7046101.1 riboflavin synthase [Dyadobacter sp. BE242]MDR7200414.1 riboflavin synthase [Dyadobacter sp. BE34]MDR7218374.1 riboflavin synthase [Dyadobacter sp. BE31]MDR7266305.1 riboflavin synthase [Dyadobacter sp. BE32]
MFTGIVEAIAEVVNVDTEGTNKTFTFRSAIANEFKIDQSVSHNGVCLTVVATDGDQYKVTAIEETLLKTNLGDLTPGSKVNLERCMPANGRFDGHIVQGHVDQTATCTQVQERDGSWLFDFEYNASTGNITVEKGSICINGVSLTVFNSGENTFRVAIIPYTYNFTNFHSLNAGDTVNLEFDILGKYIKRILGSYAV